MVRAVVQRKGIAERNGTGGWAQAVVKSQRLLFWRKDEPNDFFRLKLPSPGRGLSLHPDGIRLAIPHFDSRLRVFAMKEA
mgnify:CR=1 FL=1